MLTNSYTDGKVHKTWAFTLNNYTEGEHFKFKNLECQFAVIGVELGESGTPHLQGHVVFSKPTTLGKLKSNVDSRAHWSCVISEECSANYCMKDNNCHIINHRKQGERTDLTTTYKKIQDKGIQQAALEHPIEYIKFHAGLEKYAARLQPKRNFKPQVMWLYGSTGTGKTRYVVDREPDLWISGKDLQWWQGYENQEAVLIDDFRGDFCTFHELLRILDRYACTVAVKGSSRELNSKRIYITCPYPPEEVYLTIEDKKQLLRRIDHIFLFTSDIHGTKIQETKYKKDPFSFFKENDPNEAQNQSQSWLGDADTDNL